jgi:hypothetical protein
MVEETKQSLKDHILKNWLLLPSRDGVVVLPLHSSKRWFREDLSKGKRIYQID